MLIKDLFDKSLDAWMDGIGPESEIVLSSRIRLARNLAGIPFPNRATAEQLAGVVKKISESGADLTAINGHEYIFVELENIKPIERYILVEKHITSLNHAQSPENRALLVRDDGTVSVMINEEDHLRIQCLMPGLNLADCLGLANKVDDTLEARQDFGFSEQLGYLTACPTNLGTGLRASAMLHLPALVLTSQINRMIQATTQLGLTVRGLYGEGTEAAGNIFQFSNQLTLGYTEQEIIDNLLGVVNQVVNHERQAREILMDNSPIALADRVWRAYGTLRYARSISGQEALALLSEVRMGIDIGIINRLPPQMFNELLVTTRPNFLQRLMEKDEIKPDERGSLRAQIIRDKLIQFEYGGN